MAMPEPDAGLSALTSAITTTAGLGFGRIWLPQLPPMPGVAPWDTLTAFAVAGQHVADVEFGAGVVIAYTQHPLALARQALTTAAAVDGRLLLGIGAGHPAIVAALGYPHDKPAAFMREYLQIVTSALTGEFVDHHGDHLTAVGQVATPGVSAPPVIIAAMGPLMLDLAGELADGTITSWAGPRALEDHVIPRITKAAKAAGRPAPQVIANLPVSVSAFPDATRDKIVAAYSMAEEAPSYKDMLAKSGASGVAEAAIIGIEAEVSAQLQRFADIGVSEFVATPFGDREMRARTLELLAATAV
jgi:F420-dependent oxidoreductase-like protein